MANTASPCSSSTVTHDVIDSKCHIKKLKSSRTCLIGYSGFISHSLGGGHTYVHQDDEYWYAIIICILPFFTSAMFSSAAENVLELRRGKLG